MFLVAGEPSGDALGGRLMAALRRQAEGGVEFAGVGGEAMAAEGLASLFPQSDVTLMGFLEVVPHLPRVLRRIDQTVTAARAFRPDAVVTIDSPGFGLRVARRLSRPGRRILLVHYVAPAVWAWRPGRAARIARYLDLILALLPFEPPWFERHGLRCVYVGHPVTESVPGGLDAQGFRRRVGIPPGAPLLVALPGSRPSEIRHLLPVFGGAIELLRRRVEGLHVVVPTVPPVGEAVAAWAASLPVPVVVTTTARDKYEAFAAGDAALAASGTVTLELAALGVPTVLAYKGNRLSAAIVRRLITVNHVGLVNIIAGRGVEPELLQENCRPETLAAAVGRLFSDAAAREAQKRGFTEVMARLAGPRPPRVGPAAAILELVAARAGSR
ncbi:MAG: lipid-A-disaccharide synthase [Rhodospirillaceae bacterium]|nr:lipid-A-disaccharide synthase [Rhodospirillaceae bacterium]